MTDQVRRNMPLFSMAVVKKLTELSARQIRYYEEQGLIHPARSEGNQRLFSFNDIDRLLEIRELIEQGVNISGIKQIFLMKNTKQHEQVAVEAPNEKVQKELTKQQLRNYLKNELMTAGRHGKASLIQGELSRFFH